MARVVPMIKETYEQVGEFEYNMINPYVQAIGMMREKYGDIKVLGFKTTTEVLAGIQFPILTMRFEVVE